MCIVTLRPRVSRGGFPEINLQRKMEYDPQLGPWDREHGVHEDRGAAMGKINLIDKIFFFFFFAFLK